MDTQAPSGLGISMGNRFFLAYVWLFYKKVVRKKEQTFILILLVLRQAVFLVGRKGIEPIKTFVIEFTAQPVLPINGTFLHKRKKKILIFFLFFFFFFFFFFFLRPSWRGGDVFVLEVLLILIYPIQVPTIIIR